MKAIKRLYGKCGMSVKDVGIHCDVVKTRVDWPQGTLGCVLAGRRV